VVFFCALQLWWDGLPLVTKSLFGGIFAVTLAANFGILPPMKLVLDFDLVWRRFEVGVSDSVCSCASVWCCLGLGLVCVLFLHSYTLALVPSLSLPLPLFSHPPYLSGRASGCHSPGTGQPRDSLLPCFLS
jgi:hypothetical protein